MPWLTADKHQEEVEAARDIVLRRLGRSSAPRAALAELLDRKEVAPHVAEEVLDRLESAGGGVNSGRGGKASRRQHKKHLKNVARLVVK